MRFEVLPSAQGAPLSLELQLIEQLASLAPSSSIIAHITRRIAKSISPGQKPEEPRHENHCCKPQPRSCRLSDSRVLGPGPWHTLQTRGRIRKPSISDTIRRTDADNWFIMYVNGELVAVDSIKFIPHNVISVDLLPAYPMTIAVIAKDNADPKTGMEYANTSIGDGGSHPQVRRRDRHRGSSWKARAFSLVPSRPRREKSASSSTTPIPENWYAVEFDDQRSARPPRNIPKPRSAPSSRSTRYHFAVEQSSSGPMTLSSTTRSFSVGPSAVRPTARSSSGFL